MRSGRKIRIAFVKFGGLSAGGTERWLQMMAANLPEPFAADYYYCDAAPYVGSDYRHPDTDPARVSYMERRGVNLIKFVVGAKDVTTPTHDWINTNFWEVFEADKYDLVQTAKAGPAEYPYHLLGLPVVEYVTLNAGVDRSPSIACSIHLSQWQRAQWYRAGGDLSKSAVIPIPAEPPATGHDLRADLGIPPDATVAGFHQRVDEHIWSSIPLDAFGMICRPDWHFVIMGGARAYRRQAEELGLRNVHFVEHSGEAERISRFLNSLDVFAHGRKDGETFGTVIAEAMMHGRPCLSHRSSLANAQPETMAAAGLFAENTSDYADKLSKLLSDSAFRLRLARNAKSHADEYYSLPSCIKELSAIYARLLGVSAATDSMRRVEYGQSDLGFLYAGDLTTQDSPGFHVMTGVVPSEFHVHELRYLLPRVRCVVDIGASTGLCTFLAARYGPTDVVVHALETNEAKRELLDRTVRLNNWEQKVRVHLLSIEQGGERCEPQSGISSMATESEASSIDQFVRSTDLSRLDLLRIDVRAYAESTLAGVRELVAKNSPILLLDIAEASRFTQGHSAPSATSLAWLEPMEYVALHCTKALRLRQVRLDHPSDEPGLYICLHRHRHRDMVTGLPRQIASILRKRSLEKATSVLRAALLAPKRVARRVAGKLRLRGLRESASISYERHHSEYVLPGALARHRALFREYEEQNAFNQPENRFGELLARHPEVRELAVDIGAGAGWLSARLSREFRRVIAIEPSGAALGLARQLFPAEEFGNIEWIEGMAEAGLRAIRISSPAFYVTGCVLSHLPDHVVARICSAICTAALQGSLLAFAECWGPESHEPMWHVRTQEWWRRALPRWQLDFHGPEIQNVTGRHKGFHGVKVE